MPRRPNKTVGPRSPLEIGRRLLALRKLVDMSQPQFCRAAKIAQSAYAQYETGKRVPSLNAANAICDAFHVTLDYIYRGDRSGLPINLDLALSEQLSQLPAAA